MSEIPFVNRLGDALEAAIAQPAGARPGRRRGRPRLGRRHLGIALAALALTGAGAAMAELLSDPVEIGFGAVGCFEGPGTEGNVAVVSDPARSPIDVCATAMAGQGFERSDLIACRWEGHGIVVVPHEGRRACRAHGLAPVPAGYTPARRRAARLDAQVKKFERAAGCLAPDEFARRLTRELRTAGWAGWRAVAGGGEGPCGRVSPATGSELLGPIGPAVDARERTIQVAAAFPLRLEELVYGAGSPGGRLFDDSGERCFTQAGIERHIRETLAPARVPIRFTVEPLAPGVEIEGARGDRYEEGCAVFTGASFRAGDEGTEILVELSRRD